MNKKFVVFALLVLTALSLVLIIVQRRKPVVIPDPERPTLVAPPPPIVFVPNAPAGVTFSLSLETTFSPPAAFPVLETTPTHPDSAVNAFAASLGLSHPRISETKASKNTYWSSDKITLSFTQKPTVSTMSLRYKTGGLTSDQRTREAAAREFLKLFLGDGASSYILLSQTSPTSEGGMYTNPSSITTLLFSHNANSVPVLITNFDAVSATVSVNENIEVVAATLVFPPKQGAVLSENAAASEEGVLQSLLAGRGVLLSSRDAPKDEYGAVPVFSHVAITAITPVYYFDESTLTLRPAYVVDGIGTAQNKNQVVRYFVYATE